MLTCIYVCVCVCVRVCVCHNSGPKKYYGIIAQLVSMFMCVCVCVFVYVCVIIKDLAADIRAS